eukprot:6176734-Amphidinium_carterae.1
MMSFAINIGQVAVTWSLSFGSLRRHETHGWLFVFGLRPKCSAHVQLNQTRFVERPWCLPLVLTGSFDQPGHIGDSASARQRPQQQQDVAT